MNFRTHLQKQIKIVVTSLAVGVAGGLAFWAINFPAPWIAGSMVAGVAAVYSGVPIQVPNWLRVIAFVLLGIQTGATVSWDTVERAGQWPLSIALLGVTVIAVTWLCAIYFRSMHRWDRQTALFASLPGALSLTLALADEAKADMRRVTIAQCVRLFFLVAALPAAISFFSPVEPVSLPSDGMRPSGIVLLLLAAGLMGLAFEKARIPAGLILGAIVGSAGLFLTGIVDGAAPNVILVPANTILGVMIASRFRGLPLADLRGLFRESMVGFLLALAISGIGAVLASVLSGLPLPLTFLAFSPGGLEAMTIMAFALHLDPAYVAAHQIARYLGICIFLPLFVSLLMSKSAVLLQDDDVLMQREKED